MEHSPDSLALVVVCNLVMVHSLELVLRQVLVGYLDMEHNLVQVDSLVLLAFNPAMVLSLDMELNLVLAGSQDNPATELSLALVLDSLVMEVNLVLVVFSPDTELNQELAHRQELVQDNLVTGLRPESVPASLDTQANQE